MQHELLFMNPVFHPGLNVTVRNGDKWNKNANVGDDLVIKETGKEPVIANGRLVGKAYIPFYAVPNEWLRYEHDPGCRDRAGLLAEMKRVYPNFSEENYVTVLLFELPA